ncbi:Transglutaminase-like superfamily protein [Paramicrobacterium humi]|uniref:Transglutaminase-like superfamily protein n=1 Tax=Paramicrobacterium humi TaxID=640635 RepID=A0A1H4J2E8_9MICO|nr:transglutaminaseTgpA domain-containing protein [Microbacterium humi]SEB40480.1 Transglutaminase-like superfamily protein [Microbacterium humi]
MSEQRTRRENRAARTTKPRRTAPPRTPGTVRAQAWVDLGVISGLLVVGMLGLTPVFGGYRHLVAGVGGLLVGAGVAYLSHRLRANAITTVLGLFVAYVLFGSVLALPNDALWFVLPTVDTLRDLALGAVFGWTDVVTLGVPVEAPARLAVLPYVLGVAAGAVTGVLALRWLPTRYRTLWRCAMLLIAPVIVFAGTVLLGTAEPFLPGVRGVVLAVGALIWLGWRRPEGKNISLSERSGLLRARVLGTAAIGVAAVLVGGAAASALTPATEARFVLRDNVQPPFDPQTYPSPLSSFREYTKTLNETDLLKVTGLRPGDRIRLAVMDSYDGHLWNVAGPELATDGSGLFELAGRTLPKAPLATIVDERRVKVDVLGYHDAWLPTVGVPESIDLTGLDRSHSTGFRFNASTSAAVLIDGVDGDTAYGMRSGIQSVPGDEQLEDVPVANVSMPPVENVPDIVVAKATEYSAGAKAPIDQLRAIESALVTNGYLSHGLETDAASSRSGHGADRMEELFTRSQLIGDEEQYASAMALMARSLGYPARVVMGFAPENVVDGRPTTVTGEDVTAWVEVPFEGVGWIPFYPTPDETEIPQDQNPKPQSEPQPQVRQPPRTEKKQDDLLTDSDIDDKDDKDKKDAFALPAWAIWSISVVGGLLLLYLVPLFVIAAVKARRAKRRRRAATADARAAGAWDEFLDRHEELGYRVPPVTRTGIARSLAEQRQTDAAGTATLDGFAFDADAAVFAGDALPDERVDALWQHADAQSRDARRAVGWWRRQLSRFRVSRARRRAARSDARRRRRDGFQ